MTSNNLRARIDAVLFRASDKASDAERYGSDSEAVSIIRELRDIVEKMHEALKLTESELEDTLRVDQTLLLGELKVYRAVKEALSLSGQVVKGE